MRAKDYKNENPAGMWLSEKLDGVNARWTGKFFESLEGNDLCAPQEYVDAMPAGVQLDCELWLGRGKFQEVISKVKRRDWDGLRVMIFDLVNAETLEVRMQSLVEMKLPDFCEVVEHTLCESAAHLRAYERELLKLGAEGVMLRRPGSLYVSGRCDQILKLKRPSASEALVVGYTKTGLLLEWLGKKFKMSSGITSQLPPVGSRITFSYFGQTTAGIPRHASFICIRNYE